MKYRAVAVALVCLGSIPVLAQSPNEREGQPRPAGGSPMADALDTDKDGVISSEELKNAASTLLKLDKNKNGKLTEDEYRRAPGPGGPGGPGPGGPGGPGGPDPKMMFSHSMAFDTDKDGKLNADELQKFIADFVQSQSRPGEPRGGAVDNRKTRPD